MTTEDILKEKGITDLTKHHNYNWLYEQINVAMETYYQSKKSQLCKEQREECVKQMNNSYKYRDTIYRVNDLILNAPEPK